MNWGITALVAAAILGGCAAPGLDPSFRLTPEGAEGLVAGSITYKGNFSGYGVSYRALTGSVEGRFANLKGSYALQEFSDFNGADLAGVVFAVPLPAGEYELFNWSIGSGVTTVYAGTPFSIRFRVEPGKMIYLGNFHFTQTAALGLTVKAATLTYKEAMARDIPMLRAKYANLADVPVAYSIAPATQVENLGGASREVTGPILFLPVPFGILPVPIAPKP